MALRRNLFIFTLILFSFSSLLVNVWAQTVTTTVVVGTTSQPPSIDGQWQQGEWDNTIQYNLTIGAVNQVKNRPTIRLVHDDVTLYGLVDVPSDNGGVFTDSSGKLSWGFVVLVFYYGAVLNLGNASQPFTFLFLNTNHTQLASTYVWCRPCTPATTATLQKDSSASTSLSATSSSSAEHRVWEFSVRLFPGITNSPLTVNASSIGFNVRVFDSAGNHMSLVGANQQAQLTFIENPTSEVANSALVLPSITLMPLLFVRQPRKS